MNEVTNITRRGFIATAAAAGGGLMIGLHLPPSGPVSKAMAASEGAELNAWVHIGTDDTITIRASQTELGQGATMGNLMMFAEEMECDWSKVTYEFATGREEYVNPLVGLQLTGGSTSTPGFWDVMRKAGAQTRHMLIQAAAKQWGVAPEECSASNSVVTHAGSGKSLTFGQLADAAVNETPPEEPALKSPDEFKLIGTSVMRLDNEVKVTGKAIFGQDVEVPGMVVGVIRHAPFGGSVAGYDEAAAKAMPGVHDVVVVGAEPPAIYLDNNVPALIVTADTYWQAEQGMKAANPTWDYGGWENLDSAQISKAFHDGLEEKGKLGRADGDVDAALASAAKVVESVYEVPYVSHTPMEPMNCTADFRGDFLEIWAPTQDPGAGYIVAEEISGLPQDKIHIHVTFTGGGFGRRVEVDYLEQAVEASMKVGKPVKLIWSREEDMQHNFHRPAYAAKMTAGLDADGKPIAWRHKIVGPGIWLSPYRSTRLKNAGIFGESDFVKGQQESGVDFHTVQGAKDIGYDFANLEVEWVQKDFPVPIVFYRAVGNTQNAFFIECFLDEVAEAAGEDPYQLRRKLLVNEPRMLAVLDLVAEKAEWDKPLPKGRYRGIAFLNSFDSPFADVMEISVRGGKRITIHRVVRAIDAGIVVNPDQFDSQFQSGLLWGLAMAMYSEHTVKNAAIVQSNFQDYRLPDISQMPVYETHFVQNKNDPTGIGEPVFTTAAPALVNAIFAATGKRIRSLPLKNHGFSLA
jgi:isoquinoline 1-oxidoreductase beta subunit